MCCAIPQGAQSVASQVSLVSQSWNFLLNQEVTNLKLVPNFFVSSQERHLYVLADILATSLLWIFLFWNKIDFSECPIREKKNRKIP